MNLLVLTLVLFPLGSVSAFPILATPLTKRETDHETTDRLLFTTPMPLFLQAHALQFPPSLDWISNGCTASPDHPLGFSFQNSCYRHDFGYHNYKTQGRFSEENRKKIDDNFKKDLYEVCAEEELEIVEETCERVADLYYTAVRTFGGLKVGMVGLSEEGEKGE